VLLDDPEALADCTATKTSATSQTGDPGPQARRQPVGGDRAGPMRSEPIIGRQPGPSLPRPLIACGPSSRAAHTAAWGSFGGGERAQVRSLGARTCWPPLGPLRQGVICLAKLPPAALPRGQPDPTTSPCYKGTPSGSRFRSNGRLASSVLPRLPRPAGRRLGQSTTTAAAPHTAASTKTTSLQNYGQRCGGHRARVLRPRPSIPATLVSGSAV